MHGREAGLQSGGLAPQDDGLPVAASVVEEVAEVVARPCIVAVAPDGPLEDGDLLEAGGKDVVRSGGPGTGQVDGRRSLSAAPRLQPGQRVVEEGLRAAVGASCHGAMQHVDGFVEQSRAGLVVGQVEGRLAAARERPAVPVEQGLLVEGPDVERVGSEHGRHVGTRRLELAGAAQQRGPEAQRGRCRGVEPTGPAPGAPGLRDVAAERRDLRPRGIGGGREGTVPAGLAEGLVRPSQVAPQPQDQAEQVAGLAVARVGVARRSGAPGPPAGGAPRPAARRGAGATRPWPCCSGCRRDRAAAPPGSSPPAAAWRGGTAAGAGR